MLSKDEDTANGHFHFCTTLSCEFHFQHVKEYSIVRQHRDLIYWSCDSNLACGRELSEVGGEYDDDDDGEDG